MGKENIVTGNDVNHPGYYNRGKVECIDAIESMASNKSPCDAFCLGNALKYIWRYPDKDGAQDLEKAMWYIRRAIEKRTVRKDEKADERMPISNSVKQKIQSVIKNEWEKLEKEKTRKIIKICALAYREEDKVGAKKIYRLIDRIDDLCDKVKTDKTFWRNADRLLIGKLGLPFDREEYDCF